MTPQGSIQGLWDAPFDCILIITIGTIWFVTYYLVQYQRWGTISIGTWIFGFDFFLKIVVMYPFAQSSENIIALGLSFAAATSHVNEALRISAGGVLAMLCGMLISSSPRPDRRFPILDRLHDLLLHGWCHVRGVFVAICMAVGLSLVLVLLGFKPFVARSLTFEDPALRPIFNLWYEVVPFAALCVTTQGIRSPSRQVVATGVLLAAIGFAGGNRTMVVMTLVQCWVIWAMPARRRGLLLPVLGALAMVAIAVVTSKLRGDDSPTISSDGTLDELLYGNDLSDLRDFGWILSGLYGARYMGLTYLAGYLSFIPTTLMSFRYDMSFGRIGTLLAGLDPADHSGLRPPLFGELYVNFGWTGVILGAVAFGIVLGRILTWVGLALREPPERARHVPQVAVWTGFVAYNIATSFIFTPAFFGVYVFAVLLGVGAVLARVR